MSEVALGVVLYQQQFCRSGSKAYRVVSDVDVTTEMLRLLSFSREYMVSGTVVPKCSKRKPLPSSINVGCRSNSF